MNQITHEVRIANWISIIEQCHEHPEDQSAKQWLADNGIPVKNYYYWQRDSVGDICPHLLKSDSRCRA